MIGMLVILVSMGVFIFGSYSWMMGQAHIDAESSSENAVESIERQMRESILVTVDGDGNGVTFELPATNADGTYAIPLAWDGVTRRIQVTDGNIVMTGTDGTSRTLARGISEGDPLNNNQPYQIFTPGPGQIPQSLTIMVATIQPDASNAPVESRSRETVFLRNVPQITP